MNAWIFISRNASDAEADDIFNGTQGFLFWFILFWLKLISIAADASKHSM